MEDIAALTKALHDERVAGNTQNVDCWACEAARSFAIAAVMDSLRRARAHSSHVEAVLDRAVPDHEDRMELWRTHWREQIRRRAERA